MLCYAMLCYAGAANSASTGMLVVDSIVPGSFAEGLLEPGDIITRVEGKVVTHFLALEDTLDSCVGATVTLNVERGSQPLQATIQVCFPVLACPGLPLCPRCAFDNDNDNIFAFQLV